MSNRESKNGRFYMGGAAENYKSNLILPENLIQKDIEEMKLQRDAEEAQRMFLELEKQKQAELDAKLATLELMPMGNKIILLPYPRNPYRKVMQGSIIVDYNGEFDNPDSGEKDKLDELVACAKVIEIGPDVKYVKVDDDVFYDPRSCYPIPFLSLGYRSTSEPQILCILNEGLKARFNMG